MIRMVLTAIACVGLLLGACRQDQPASDPRSEPNQPIPRIQRPSEDGNGKPTTSESSQKDDAAKSDAGR